MGFREGVMFGMEVGGGKELGAGWGDWLVVL